MTAPHKAKLPGVAYHAQERLFEHHGIVAQPEEWLAAVLDIIDGRALIVRTCGNVAVAGVDACVYALTIQDQVIEVVWSVRSGAIVTVLPPASRSGETRRVRAPRVCKNRPVAGWRDRKERARFVAMR